MKLPSTSEWQPIETAPFHKDVLAWLYLPKNPPASGCAIAQRCYVEKDEPLEYGEFRRTVGCWWSNGMYYPAGYVTHWMLLPLSPELEALRAQLPSVREPKRCAEFVGYLHDYRRRSGVRPVTDAEAVQAFDIIENFWGERPLAEIERPLAEIVLDEMLRYK